LLSKTKISNGNSTVIPSEIRHKLHIEPGDLLLWELKKDKIVVEHRKKITIDDITGIITKGGDAVRSKRKIQRGM
jgi:AbrB family looped-hinge helix DNA binding protein